MRIISGCFKGKKILEPKDFKTRPLKDLTKESIFNIINHSNKFQISIKSSKILDLFAGVGSFGMECLSRGAKKVVFIEKYVRAIEILKKNLKNLNLDENYEIIEKNVYDNSTLLSLKNKFNIIFIDPPYKDKSLDQVLMKIRQGNILDKNGIIIIHRHKKENDSFLPNFKIIDEKKYGISKIFFLTILN